MKLSKEELLEKVRAIIGDSEEEEVLSLYEDIADSVGEGDGSAEELEKLKADYAELDSSWRKRYRDRFFGHADEDEEKKMDVEINIVNEDNHDEEEVKDLDEVVD